MSLLADLALPALAGIPEPSRRHIALRVTPAAERALRQGHPWLFDRAIRQQSQDGRPGDLAVIFDRKGRFLAVGLYDPLSSLRVRVLAHGEPVTIDRHWFALQLAAAAQVRAPLAEQAEACTSDGIPPTPLHKGGKEPQLVAPLHEGDKEPDLVASVHEGGKEPQLVAPVHEGGKEPQLVAPLHKGGKEPDLVVPLHERGKEPQLVAPLHEGGKEPDLVASVHEGGKEPDLVASVHEGGKEPQLVAPLTKGGRGDHPLTTGYRLVHGENDGLPGLVVDRYERTFVVKLYTAAWLPHLRDVLAALISITPIERIVLRLGRGMQRQTDDLYGLSDGQVLMGPPLDGPLLFWENGLRFEADPVRGQKTGFFLDQRDNRARVEKLAAGKTVLNLFAYSGGFSVYAARGGARSVLSVDTSAPALEAARRNWERNRQFPGVAAASHDTVVEDAFHFLARMGQAGRRFGLVIVDPPAFAQEAAQVPQALAAYERLTRLALDVLAPGGTLVQASCSSRIDADTFFATVHRAAARAGRPLRELERSGHALDHPVAFKEGAYLKCLFAVAP